MTAQDGAAAPAAPAPAPSSRPPIVCPDSGPEPPYPLRMEGLVISGFGRGSKELGIPTANLPVDEAATPWIANAQSGVYFGYASLCLPPAHPDFDAAASSPSDPSTITTNLPSLPPPSSAPSSTTDTTTTTTNNNNNNSATSAPTTTQQPTPPEQQKQQQPVPPAPAPPAQPQDRWHVYPMVMSIGYNPFYGNAARSAEVHVLRRFGADFYARPLRLLLLASSPERGDYPSLRHLVDDIATDCDVARASLARPAWTPAAGAGAVPVVVSSSAAAAAPAAAAADAAAVAEAGEDKVQGSLDAAWLVR